MRRIAPASLALLALSGCGKSLDDFMLRETQINSLIVAERERLGVRRPEGLSALLSGATAMRMGLAPQAGEVEYYAPGGALLIWTPGREAVVAGERNSPSF